MLIEGHKEKIKYLNQYKNLHMEIRELEGRIKKIENRTHKIERDKVKGSSNGFPYNERSFTIEGYNIQNLDRLNKLKKLLSKRKNKCRYMELDIEEFISSIPDSLTRMVFQYRYINQLSWQSIAIRIGKTDESYPRKIIHDRYLDRLD